MTFVCLSTPSWSTGAAPAGEGRARATSGHAPDAYAPDAYAPDAHAPDAHAPDAHAMTELLPALLAVAPRVAAGARGAIWADARGLSARPVAESLLAIAHRHGHPDVRAGIAGTPVAAEVAAVYAFAEIGAPPPSAPPSSAAHSSPAPRDPITLVPPGADRLFLAPHPVAVLAPPPRLAMRLGDVGIETCGDLAARDQESIEVRFGAEGVALWRLARADDPRLIFTPMPRGLPTASLEWMEYTLRDPERLLFVINALASTVCTELRSWGEGARVMTLGISLAGGGTVEHRVHAARATASRKTWMRRIRAELERLELPDAVTGIALRAERVTEATGSQGDLFDRGFATASATENALAQLLEEQGAIIAGLVTSDHPLLDRRATWRARDPAEATTAHEHARVRGMAAARAPAAPASPAAIAAARLTVQLLPEPRRVVVVTARRRGHRIPLRYRARVDAAGDTVPREIDVVTAAGPDCISGGAADAPYAREYFHCVTSDGSLVLLFRDARTNVWYLHGWWD